MDRSGITRQDIGLQVRLDSGSFSGTVAMATERGSSLEIYVLRTSGQVLGES